jgi:hypothetical protein
VAEPLCSGSESRCATESTNSTFTSGSGGESDGGSQDWSYSANGGYAQSNSAGSTSGTLGGSGSENYTYGHSASASMTDGIWGTSGSGSISDTAAYQYSYNGAGGGTVPDDAWSDPGMTWSISNEQGSGTVTCNDPLNDNNGWTDSLAQLLRQHDAGGLLQLPGQRQRDESGRPDKFQHHDQRRYDHLHQQQRLGKRRLDGHHLRRQRLGQSHLQRVEHQRPGRLVERRDDRLVVAGQ